MAKENKYLIDCSFLDEKGNLVDVKIDSRKWKTYVLFNKGLPVYVGTTFDLERRLKSHRSKNKILFDSYCENIGTGNWTVSHVSEKETISILKMLFHDSILNKICKSEFSKIKEY